MLTTTVRLVALSPPNSSVGDPVTDSLQGWQSDRLGRFTQRYYLNGDPTYLVRNGDLEGFDDPVAEPDQMVSVAVVPIGTYSQPIDPIVIAASELEALSRSAIEVPFDDGAINDDDPPTSRTAAPPDATAAPRLSTYPPEYAPPASPLPAFQPPIYPSPTYAARIVFAQLLSEVENPGRIVESQAQESEAAKGTPSGAPTDAPPSQAPVAQIASQNQLPSQNKAALAISEPPLWKRKRVQIGLAIAAAVLVATAIAAAISIANSSSGASRVGSPAVSQGQRLVHLAGGPLPRPIPISTDRAERAGKRHRRCPVQPTRRLVH